MTEYASRIKAARQRASLYFRFFWLAMSVSGALLSPVCTAEAQDKVLAVYTNFTQTGAIVYYNWPADVKSNAVQYSWRTNVLNAELGRKVYRLTMATNFPWQWTSGASTLGSDTFSVFSLLNWDYLLPEADEIRIRLKVVSGRFQLAFGCINLAFAPSDTFTDIRVVDESADGWQTLRFSLHKNLIRNYRRNAFTENLPYITITRWIQENLMLYLFRSGNGELLVDRVELVSTGLGRPYPQPAPEQITPVATVADFETTNDLSLAFSYTTVPLDLSGPRPTNYTKTSTTTSGKIVVAGKTIQWYQPPRRALIDQSTNGLYSLEVKQTGYESFAFTGLRLPNPDGANAIQMTLRADHSSTLTNLVFDFLAYAAPPASKAAFPWTNCQPATAWMEDTNLNFDLYLAEENTTKESYALYHLRRTVTNHQWNRILLPLDDFAGFFSCNAGTNLMKTPLQALRSTNLLFLGFFSPYKQLSAETRLWIDDVSLVRVESTPEQLRSFWQNPGVTNAQLIALTNFPSYYGHMRQRDRNPGPMSLRVMPGTNNVTVPISGPAEQRYNIYSSDDCKRWQPVTTGYVDSPEGPWQTTTKKPAQFYKAISD
jgi:hypothetical protein